jgi:tungstate transport system permease protein
MDFFWEGLKEAVRLIVSGDQHVLHAIFVSVSCTVVAVTLAAFLAIPYGAWLGLYRPPASRLQALMLRVGMFVPTVVVGLGVYGLLSNHGLLGAADLLYTKFAIIVGEFLLAFPIIGSLTYASVAQLDRTALETVRTLGASRWRAMWTMVAQVRVPVMTALLMAFARCFTELGVATTVGGNLEMRTRTLASTVVLDLSRGRFAEAMAPGLILILIAILITAVALRFAREQEQ